MINTKIDYTVSPGSTTTKDTNEDYLWVGSEDGINALLILDGTSGVSADFGAKNGKTGGRRYVEAFGESVKQKLKQEPQADLEKVMKNAVKTVWNKFEEDAQKNSENYFNGNDVVLQRADTIPAAVGTLIKWDKENLEVLHVGDVETCIITEDGTDNFSNVIHEKFDSLRDDYIEKYGKDSKEVKEILRRHRSAHNLPGTYPNMSFNPLAIEELGEKVDYNIEKVEKVLLSTDGAAPRIKKLLSPENNKEVIKLIEDKGSEEVLDELREKEEKADLNQLKSSDDAAIALIEFQK